MRMNNKGFSLVELLVGVAILAIIAVPLARAFITSASTSVRAKDIRSQTVAAQNILESYEATSIGAIIDALAHGGATLGGGTVKPKIEVADDFGNYATVNPADDAELDRAGEGYKLYLTDVPSGVDKYDAVVTLDAASEYAEINDEPIVNAKPMSAIVQQPKDEIAAKDIAQQAQIDSGDELADDFFLYSMDRTITVTIGWLTDENDDRLQCQAEYEYVATYDGEVYEYTAANDVYCDPYSADFAGEYGLFVFFYPNHNTAFDKINIVNRDNLEMNVYLACQDPIPSNYEPMISLREKNYGQGNSPAMSLYTNFPVEARFYPGTLIAGSGYQDGMRYPYDCSGELGGQTAQNRIYTVRVELYAPGDVGGKILASFDASSIE